MYGYVLAHQTLNVQTIVNTGSVIYRRWTISFVW